MPGAATYEPDLAVLLGEIAAQALHLGERAVGGFAMALGAEGHNVAHDAIGADRHRYRQNVHEPADMIDKQA